MLAYCGLTCDTCGAYIATRENDDVRREKVAKEWSKTFNVEIPASSINCDGCKSEGIKFSHCNNCEIRKCALEKGVENCGKCAEFACEKLDFIFKAEPEAKRRLENQV
ncbi:MAG: DUF3795 domain-containing protein [Desulfobacterales bacterium]|nr:DUF3795 domain-containing protein [Desulfobacterales bacterium]MCP4158581.1 DUF3795 domain-containing protein [Deltaproteobacteria bacterium]